MVENLSGVTTVKGWKVQSKMEKEAIKVIETIKTWTNDFGSGVMDESAEEILARIQNLVHKFSDEIVLDYEAINYWQVWKMRYS